MMMFSIPCFGGIQGFSEIMLEVISLETFVLQLAQQQLQLKFLQSSTFFW